MEFELSLQNGQTGTQGESAFAKGKRCDDSNAHVQLRDGVNNQNIGWSEGGGGSAKKLSPNYEGSCMLERGVKRLLKLEHQGDSPNYLY